MSWYLWAVYTLLCLETSSSLPSQVALSHLSFSVLWMPVQGREVGSRGVCVETWRVFVFLSFSSLFPLGISSLIFYWENATRTMESKLSWEKAMDVLPVLTISWGSQVLRGPPLPSCTVWWTHPSTPRKHSRDASFCHYNYGQRQEIHKGKRLTPTLSLGIGRQLRGDQISRGIHGTILFLKSKV